MKPDGRNLTPLRALALHEVLHAIFEVTGDGRTLGDDVEEGLVTRTTPVLLGVLRENPELVEFLLADA